MPITFTVASTAPDPHPLRRSRGADLRRRRARPGRRRGRCRVRWDARRVHGRRRGSRASAARRCSCPSTGRRRPRCCRAGPRRGRHDRRPADRSRDRSPSARQKSVRVATTLADAAPEDADRADAAQAVVEGVLLGGYEYLTYKSKPAKPVAAEHVTVLWAVAARRQACASTAACHVSDAACWARRHGEHAGARAVAGRVRQGRAGAAARTLTSASRCSTSPRCARNGSAVCSASGRVRSSRRDS